MRAGVSGAFRWKRNFERRECRYRINDHNVLGALSTSLLQDLLDLPVTLPEPIAAYAAALAAYPSVAPEDARYRAVLAQWAETKLNG